MLYEGNIIRPPSEADSIILQVTVGCSHNRCTFCGAYRGVRFKMKEEDAVVQDITWASRVCTRLHSVFLADGDALVMPMDRLVRILMEIEQKLPWVRRVGIYANARSILRRSVTDLAELKKLGLRRIYTGLESGHDPILEKVCKGATAADMIIAADRVRDAKIFHSVTALLGIGGSELSRVHAEATGRILSRMAPNQIAVLALMVLENTPLASDVAGGIFQLPSPKGLLEELHTMLEHIHCDRVQFHANHASNYLPLSGRLQHDKASLLAMIDQAMAGERALRPESMRAL